VTAEAALEYAERGWSVFPVVPREKRPLTENGFKNATTDLAQITAWWERWPDAGVAIATGSDLVVLDVDLHGSTNGFDSLARLRSDHGDLPETITARTGGGGVHFFLRVPPNAEVPNRKNVGGYAGLDLKGTGGYIVASPSIHPSGRRYQWKDGFSPSEMEIADCPEFVLELAETGPSTARVSYEPHAWRGELPLTASEAIARFPRVWTRFHRGTDGLGDTSPSGVDFSLCCQLATLGLSGGEVESAVRSSRDQAGLRHKRPSYYSATVEKALAFAQEARPS